MGLTVRSQRLRPSSAALTVVLGVVALLSATLVFAASKPRIWLDRPLPGAILLYGPTTVTVHAASPSGISVIRFSVDGSPAGEVGAPGGELVTVEWAWTPDSPGIHVVTAFARGVDGVFSDPVAATVTFVGRDELPPSPPPTPSSAPLPTPTFVATPGPTLPPGATPTPTPHATPTPTPAPTRTQPPSPSPSASDPMGSSEPSAEPTPTPAPTPTPCYAVPPTPLLPEDGKTDLTPASEGVSHKFEWSYAGPDCLTSFRLEISLDWGSGMYEDYAPSYQFVQEFAPDTTFWDSTILFYIDGSDPAPGHCGYYHWQVFAIVGEETGEASSPFSFDVCDVDG